MQLLQQFCGCWKHLWKSSSATPLRHAVAFCRVSSTDVKRWPFGPILSLGKSRKSHGARSGDYGGWVMGRIWLFARNWCRPRKVSWGLCSWCRIQLFLHGRQKHTDISQPVATCPTSSTQSNLVHPTHLVSTGSGYLDKTKFQDIFYPPMCVCIMACVRAHMYEYMHIYVYSGTSVYVRFGISPTWYTSWLDAKNFALVYDLCLEYDSRARTCRSQNESWHCALLLFISLSTLLSKEKWG
jgi:hypothetical protein